MYEKFFPELFEFQVGLMTNLIPRLSLHCFPLSLGEIFLPTTEGCRGERAWERGLISKIFVTVQQWIADDDIQLNEFTVLVKWITALYA